MNKEASIQHLNNLSKQKIPFVFIIDYNAEHALIWKTTEIPKNIFISFPSFCNYKKTIQNTIISYTKNPIPFLEYTKAYNCVQKHLHYGNSYLVNLTAESEIKSTNNLAEIFHSSIAPYKLMIENECVVFSPEPFITINNKKIATFPMKGTINACIPNAEEEILSNKKEKAEHATIVDLLRNDLSIVANNVNVTNYRYIEKISSQSDTLLQVSSCIEGEIKPKYIHNVGTLLYSMLPAGSICGAPKTKTLEIIKEVETHNRGFYTGVMGYFDGTNLESAVMIRYIEQRNNMLFYKSGGGITTQSKIKEEYNELIQKIYVPTH